MAELSEYTANALKDALRAVNENQSIRWFSEQLDRFDRQLEDYRQLVERAEAVGLDLSGRIATLEQESEERRTYELEQKERSG